MDTFTKLSNKKNKQFNLTLIGGGRVIQSYLSALKSLYDHMPNLLPKIKINIILPEQSKTKKHIEDPLFWGKSSTKSIDINTQVDKLEEIINESDLRIVAFSGIRWSQLAKEKRPRFKEIEVNGAIAKKYAKYFYKDNSKTINVTNQTETISTIMQKIISHNTKNSEIIPFGMKLDAIRAKTYILENYYELKDIVNNHDVIEVLRNISVCGLHGAPFVLIKDLFNEKEIQKLDRDEMFYSKVLEQQLKIRNYTIEKPKEIVQALGYLPDMITGPEILNMAFNVLGIDKYIMNITKKYDKVISYNTISDNKRYQGKQINIKKLIQIYEKSKEKIYELETLTRTQILDNIEEITDKELEKIAAKTEFLFYSGEKTTLNYEKYTKTDFVLAYLGLTDLFKSHLIAVEKEYI